LLFRHLEWGSLAKECNSGVVFLLFFCFPGQNLLLLFRFKLFVVLDERIKTEWADLFLIIVIFAGISEPVRFILIFGIRKLSKPLEVWINHIPNNILPLFAIEKVCDGQTTTVPFVPTLNFVHIFGLAIVTDAAGIARLWVIVIWSVGCGYATFIIVCWVGVGTGWEGSVGPWRLF